MWKNSAEINKNIFKPKLSPSPPPAPTFFLGINSALKMKKAT